MPIGGRDQLITSATNQRVKQLVALRTRQERDAAGVFVAEGHRAVERLMAAGRRIETLFVQDNLNEGGADSDAAGTGSSAAAVLVAKARAAGAEIVLLSPAVMAKASYRDRPEGILAIAPQWHDELNSVVPTNGLVVIAEGVEKPGNLGAILRTADATGCDAVVVCDERVDLFNPNVIRAATAVVFSMPVVSASSERIVAWVRGNRLQLVATTPDTELLHWDADLRRPTAVLMGAEDTGLSDFWLRQADVSVRLPMAGQADSLNVGVATAVVLYEAVRQRSILNPPHLTAS